MFLGGFNADKMDTLPSDEVQNDIQADAGKDETVESIRHIE